MWSGLFYSITCMATRKPRTKKAAAPAFEVKQHIPGSMLLGQKALIQFPESTCHVRYSITGELHWQVTDKDGRETQGVEKIAYLQMSDSLHFLNWREKTGFNVSQIIDLEKGSVTAFWSYADDSVFNGRCASMFVTGSFSLLA